MTAELQIGSRVRFRGIYRCGGQPDDPDQPHAILTTGTRTRVFSLVNGELRKEKVGVYSFLVVVEAMAKFINVKFCSAQGVGQPFAEQNFKVSSERQAYPGTEPRPPVYMAPEQPLGPPPIDQMRADMVDALRADGFRVDDTHSDAFIRGAHEQLRKKRDEEKAKKLSEWWRRGGK